MGTGGTYLKVYEKQRQVEGVGSPYAGGSIAQLGGVSIQIVQLKISRSGWRLPLECVVGAGHMDCEMRRGILTRDNDRPSGVLMTFSAENKPSAMAECPAAPQERAVLTSPGVHSIDAGGGGN